MFYLLLLDFYKEEVEALCCDAWLLVMGIACTSTAEYDSYREEFVSIVSAALKRDIRFSQMNVSSCAAQIIAGVAMLCPIRTPCGGNLVIIQGLLVICDSVQLLTVGKVAKNVININKVINPLMKHIYQILNSPRLSHAIMWILAPPSPFSSSVASVGPLAILALMLKYRFRRCIFKFQGTLIIHKRFKNITVTVCLDHSTRSRINIILMIFLTTISK